MTFAALSILPKGKSSDAYAKAAFKREFTGNGLRYLYHSEQGDALCLGHQLLSKLTPEQLKEKHLFIIQADTENCVVVVIEKVVIAQTFAVIADLDELFGYDLASTHPKHIWVSDGIILTNDCHQVLEAKWLEQPPAKYIVKNTKKTIQQAFIACGLVGLAVLGGKYITSTPATPEPSQQVKQTDPWDGWRSAITQQYSAQRVLNEAATLYSYGLTLPSSWPMSEIQFVGGSLLMSTDRQASARQSEWESFITSTPQLSTFVTGDRNNWGIKVPMVKSTGDQQITNLKDRANDLYDYLAVLGAEKDLLVIHENKILYSEYRFSMKFTNVSFALLNTLSDVFAKEPAFITALVAKRNDDDPSLLSDLTLNITLQGVEK